MANCDCDVKRIKPLKLCTGDLRYLVSIQTRGLVDSDFTDSQPNEPFTTVRSQWCGLETINSGVRRFAKINILEEATHIFWTQYDVSFPDIENLNHWVLHDSKRYKVLKVENVNERNVTIAIQTTERGNTSEDASDA